MADQPTPPQLPDPGASHHELIEDRFETATLRRSPKYSVFLLLGAALGLIVAMILTFSFEGTGESSTGMVYSQGQIFGFLLLLCVPIGVALLGLVALILDRTIGRRSRQVAVDRESVHVVD